MPRAFRLISVFLRKLYGMKFKCFLASALFAVSLAFLPACSAMQNPEYSSLKSLSRPYIAQYECTEARLGDTNLLQSFDYIKIIFINAKEFEIAYKPAGGEKKIYSGNYSADPSSHEIVADITVLGHKFKEKTKIENGKIAVRKTVGNKELYLLFEVK